MLRKLTPMTRTAQNEKETEPWKVKAAAEGITADEIERVDKMEIEYPIFFARMLHKQEISPAHFEDEARFWLEQFNTYKPNFAPATPDDMHTLSELSGKITQIEDEMKAAKSGKPDWFDPDGVMKRLSVVKSNSHLYEVYRYDDWHNQRHLLAYPRMLCIGEQLVGEEKQYTPERFHQYGGEFNIIVRDGKQWTVMSKNRDIGGGFQRPDNATPTYCEKAISILVSWDESGVWQNKIVEYVKICNNPSDLLEIKSLMNTLPEETKMELKAYYLMESRKPEKMMALLIGGSKDTRTLDETDKELLAEVRSQIAEGSFPWKVVLRPMIETLPDYVLAPSGPADVERSAEFSRQAFMGVKLAIDTEIQMARQRLARDRQEGRQPTDDEKLRAYAPLMKLKEYLEKPDIERGIATHLELVDMPAMLALMGSLEKAELKGLASFLKEMAVFKASGLGRRMPEYESQIFSTGNHHAIRSYYQSSVRGTTGYRRSAGGGLPWPALESFIIDEIMRGNRDGEVRDTIRDYLSKVENPATRVEIMRQAAEAQGEGRAAQVMASIERMLPSKMRGQPARGA
jgi:hypothetical protein